MTKERVRRKVEELLAKEYHCSPAELNGKETVFSIKTDAGKPYLKIMAYRHCIIVCTSKELHKKMQELLSGKSRDEIFELPYVYGQTIHYIPDCSSVSGKTTLQDRESQSMQKAADGRSFAYECLFQGEIDSLRGLTGFGNSLEFEEDGSTPAQAVCIAKDKGKIIGVAGASGSPVNGMWEVGVDVMEDYRNAGLGTFLVSRLTEEVTARNIVPFYSASVTNIGSQMVASRCGYLPSWVDTYGTTLDGSSVYGRHLLSLSLE